MRETRRQTASATRLRLVSTISRSPGEIFQELSVKCPEKFAAMVRIADLALKRAQDHDAA